MKRIVSIQDISAVGKCSLTVALPIISAMGVECAVLPTAVLSTHTMFKNFTFHDLTDEMEPIGGHWQREGLSFDAIYTGYLGSYRQIDLVADFFKKFGGQGKIIVDPAMADNGRMYPGFDGAFAKRMSTLCKGADLVLPNITEACFMLGMDYREKYDRQYIRDLLSGLLSLGAKNAAVTGVSLEEGKLGAAALDGESGEYFTCFGEHLPATFHGTGDIFSSAVVGAMMNGLDVNASLALAVDYTAQCIRLTLADPKHNWYGVNFEEATPYLLKLLGK